MFETEAEKDLWDWTSELREAAREREATEAKARTNRHSETGDCPAARCREADGYQCDGCGHYYARGSGTAYASGEFLCRGCR